MREGQEVLLDVRGTLKPVTIVEFVTLEYVKVTYPGVDEPVGVARARLIEQ